MPTRQNHRGRHPEDDVLFSAKYIPVLRRGVVDLSFLFSRGYSDKSAVKLVGDHYQLDTRQRRAVRGAACSDESQQYRAEHHVSPGALDGTRLCVDGYNLLITVESALAGGVLLRGRDGCIRDLASLHRSYRKVAETVPAVRLIGETLVSLNVASVHWHFDAPISNSGRLRALLCEEAENHGWNWDVALTDRTDQVIRESSDVVVTSDSWILDGAERWTNLTQHVVGNLRPAPDVVDLGCERD